MFPQLLFTIEKKGKEQLEPRSQENRGLAVLPFSAFKPPWRSGTSLGQAKESLARLSFFFRVLPPFLSSSFSASARVCGGWLPHRRIAKPEEAPLNSQSQSVSQPASQPASQSIVFKAGTADGGAQGSATLLVPANSKASPRKESKASKERIERINWLFFALLTCKEGTRKERKSTQRKNDCYALG